MRITAMDKIWASRVWAGAKTLDDAARVGRRESVKFVMHQDVAAGKNDCTPERYEEITGEAYVPDSDT